MTIQVIPTDIVVDTNNNTTTAIATSTTTLSANKVIIFDWDDTICPSSFVDNYQIEHIDELPKDVSTTRKEKRWKFSVCFLECISQQIALWHPIIIRFKKYFLN